MHNYTNLLLNNDYKRRPTKSPSKSPLSLQETRRKVEMETRPNFFRVDFHSAIAESYDLLKEVKSWYKELEKDSTPQPAPRRKQEGGGAPIRSTRSFATRRTDFASPAVEKKVNLAKKVNSEMDLRTDIDSLRKEVKRLTKKIAKKSDKKHSKKHKGTEKKENRHKAEKADLEVSALVKNLSVKSTHSYETVPQQNKLQIATLQDLSIRRPLSVQTGPCIVISPKPVLSRYSNVHFATFEHQAMSSKTPLKEIQQNELESRADQISTENAAVSTDAVPVFTTGCQTSPPPQVFSIFAQTEEITIRRSNTMVSVAVQSSPEVKAQCTDFEVQTEIVQFKSVATETVCSPPPLSKDGEKSPQVGPSGDHTPNVLEEDIPPEELPQEKTKDLSRLSRVSLSPIMEVPSTNISPDIISPLTTPKASLVMPETSKSDYSAISADLPREVENEKKHKSPPKSVAFADLPMLLRLRSPTQKLTMPSYQRKLMQRKLKSDSSDFSSEDEDETITNNNELQTQTSSGSRSTSPTSTVSSIEFTTSSSAAAQPKAPISIPVYQMNRIRSLAAKMAPKLLDHTVSDDGELSEGQIWPLPNRNMKRN